MTLQSFSGVMTVAAVCWSAAVATPHAMGQQPAAPPAVPAQTDVNPPDDYIVGPEDVLVVKFWKDNDMSGEVVVRPDGKITLPLLNDVVASGLTLEQLRLNLQTAAEKFQQDASATVTVKQINSRKVFITGEVAKSGSYPLIGPTTVLQLIATAGGLNDFAKRKEIVIVRKEAGKDVIFPFDYTSVGTKDKAKQNIFLKPGDTVVVR